VLHIGLHSGIVELSSDQTLGIEDGVRWVDSNLGKEQKDTLKNEIFIWYRTLLYGSTQVRYASVSIEASFLISVA
jgi:hypothetical protein